MPLFKLKAGSHAVGSGEDAWVYRAKENDNNIVESESDLSVTHPGKFERFDGAEVPPQRGPRRLKVPAPNDPANLSAEQARNELAALRKELEALRARQAAPAQQQPAATPQKPLAWDGKPAEAAGDWSDEDLESLTVAELRELAAEEEIDLKGASRKDEIVAAIRAARK